MRFAQDSTRIACGDARQLKKLKIKLKSNTLFRSSGAHDRNRTGDLVLTKDVLYRLSYVGLHLDTRHSRRHVGWSG